MTRACDLALLAHHLASALQYAKAVCEKSGKMERKVIKVAKALEEVAQ